MLTALTPVEEKKRLQIIVAALTLVPLLAGGFGMVYGLRMTGEVVPGMAIDSHVRYLSGLLFGIGLAFLASVPAIETHGPRCRMLAAIVFIGGLARLGGLIGIGWPGFAMFSAIAMELIIVPLLCLWQWRVARRLSGIPVPSSPDPAFQD
jgi:hypothetical protein